MASLKHLLNNDEEDYFIDRRHDEPPPAQFNFGYSQSLEDW